MPVPTYEKFIEPIFRCLARHPDGAAARDVHEAAADDLGIPELDREELLPSGVQRVYKNRAGWAHDRLKRAGYSACPRRGFWQLTDAGLAFLRLHPEKFTGELVGEIATGNEAVRLREDDEQTPNSMAPLTTSSVVASPDDRLEAAVAELRATTTAELLETLSQVSPKFFETIVLDVLHKIGYGTSRGDLAQVGKSGDGGIDGIISLDRLGLEKVYVQAKRWQNTVGRPEVHAFYGALAGQRATKGVFITTSTFTAQAVEFARSVERLVLVDGKRLAELIIDFEVGVAMRPVRVPKLDTDYFEEE
jgi:restriction system protein